MELTTSETPQTELPPQLLCALPSRVDGGISDNRALLESLFEDTPGEPPEDGYDPESQTDRTRDVFVFSPVKHQREH